MYSLNCTLLATPKPVENPCRPSPCGPNSQCRETNNHAICSCSVGYIGVPPMCRPECVVSSECPQNKACINEKCVDPCPGTCGHNTRCNVVNHNPICSCSSGYTGDPFIGCERIIESMKLSNFVLHDLFVNSHYLFHSSSYLTGPYQSLCSLAMRTKFAM